MHNLPSQGARIVAVRGRLFDLLGASNAAESETVRYVTRALPVEAAELLADMAEREIKRATAEGYETGWREAGGVQ
jgi:hypothetical protein